MEDSDRGRDTADNRQDQADDPDSFSFIPEAAFEDQNDTEDRHSEESPVNLCREELPVIAYRREGPFAVILHRKKAHEEEQDSYAQIQQTAPGQGCRVLFLHDLRCHTGTQKQRHVKPAGVIVGVESGEGGIQSGHKGHDKKDPQQSLFPAQAPHHPIGKDACHGKAGKIKGQ